MGRVCVESLPCLGFLDGQRIALQSAQVATVEAERDLEGAVDQATAEAIARRFALWRAQPGSAVGVQVDFDASTRRLDRYAAFLRDLRKALPEGWIDPSTVWHINPTGKFFIGGNCN